MEFERSGSLTIAAKELARYKLELVGVKEVSWDKGGHCKSRGLYSFYGKGKENRKLGTGFLLYNTEQNQQIIE